MDLFGKSSPFCCLVYVLLRPAMLTQCLCRAAQGGCHEPEERSSHLRPLQAQVVSSPTFPVRMCTSNFNGAL